MDHRVARGAAPLRHHCWQGHRIRYGVKIMSDRRRFGGMNTSSAAYGAGDARADLFPPLPARSILESVEVSEAPVHKFQAIESLLLSVATAAGLVVAFVLLFVDLG